MRLPVLQGLIRRRVLVNFRVDPRVMLRHLPRRFAPKLHDGWAVAGVCLIRLEHIRPKGMPEAFGLSSENAAHRVAVTWEEGGACREGVFITRRDTGSRLNRLAGGRVFPGEHHPASFDVQETDDGILVSLRSDDSSIAVEVAGREAVSLPPTSVFKSLPEASAFFESGSLGFSVTGDAHRLDGITLKTAGWRVVPLEVRRAYSSYFADESIFPKGSIEFDHALLMRDIPHEWHSADDLYV
jgi:hypothetical protein